MAYQKIHPLRLLLAVFILFLAMGCVSIGENEMDDYVAVVVEEKIEEEQIALAEIVITNSTLYKITEVFIMEEGSGPYGDDLLLGGEIEPYGTKSISVPIGELMLLATVMVGGERFEVADGAEFEADGTYGWTIGERYWTGSTKAQSYNYLASYGYMANAD